MGKLPSKGQAIRKARKNLGMTQQELADSVGVARATIIKFEKGGSMPSVDVTGQLSGVLQIPISEINNPGRASGGNVQENSKRDELDDEDFTDNDNGLLLRRVLSPSSPEGKPDLEIIRIRLKSGAKIKYPKQAYFFRHQILVEEGELYITYGDQKLRPMVKDDCLDMGPPAVTIYENRGSEICQYLVVISYYT